MKLHLFNALLLELLGLFRALRPALGPACCRFSPSCSDYAQDALMGTNGLHALWLIGARILKCQPFHPGGFDPCPAEPAPAGAAPR